MSETRRPGPGAGGDRDGSCGRLAPAIADLLETLRHRPAELVPFAEIKQREG